MGNAESTSQRKGERWGQQVKEHHGELGTQQDISISEQTCLHIRGVESPSNSELTQHIPMLFPRGVSWMPEEQERSDGSDIGSSMTQLLRSTVISEHHTRLPFSSKKGWGPGCNSECPRPGSSHHQQQRKKARVEIDSLAKGPESENQTLTGSWRLY